MIHRTKTILGLSLALLTTAACAANEDGPTVADSEQALDEGTAEHVDAATSTSARSHPPRRSPDARRSPTPSAPATST